MHKKLHGKVNKLINVVILKHSSFLSVLVGNYLVIQFFGVRLIFPISIFPITIYGGCFGIAGLVSLFRSDIFGVTGSLMNVPFNLTSYSAVRLNKKQMTE